MKVSRIIAIALSVALFSGCGKHNPVNNNPPDQKFSIAKSETVARENPSASNDIVMKQAESINNFSVAMYQQLKEEGKNLFFSPYSITAALAMTAAGANGNTKQQILDALQVTLQGNAFDEAINAIDQSVVGHAAATEGLTLNVVNSAWMLSGWNFKVSYLDHLARYYGAGINLLDFSTPDECRVVINTWVAGQTNDKILDLLPEGSIDAATVLVLTNAIYFLADWLYSFNPDCTKDKDFRLLDNSTVNVPSMSYNKSDSAVVMRYSRATRVSALDFPYKGDRLAMTVLLPDSGAFTNVEDSLSTAMLNRLFSDFHPETLQVSLPKFKFTFGTVSLKYALNALGMVDAFLNGYADFSGIDGTKDLWVHDIYHKAFISIDEKGTEAAAATAAVIVYKSLRPVFIVNRPFIFVIRDKETGVILFMGRILNPLESQ